MVDTGMADYLVPANAGAAAAVMEVQRPVQVDFH